MGADGNGGDCSDANSCFGIASRRATSTQHRRGGVALSLVAGLASCLGATDVDAQAIHVSSAISVLETYTNNVDLSPSSSARGDWVSQITPRFGVDVKGTHSSLVGSVSIPILLYAKTGAENNTVYGSGNLLGSIELIDKFFFIEAAVDASQQFFNPFGARPTSLVNATENRYTSVVYRVSPYIKGVAAGDIDYQLRFNSVWSNLSGAPIDVSNAHYTEWIGTANSPVAPWGWGLDYDRTEVIFTDQAPQTTQLGRFRLRFEPNPNLQLGASGGYEDNHYPLTSSSGAIYGVSAAWRPSERTSAAATWEHRFFGSSYLVAFDHRMPTSAFNVRISRNITSYPQQVAALPAGGNVSSLLNAILTTRIPDPTQRQTAVDQIIQDRGLPQVLSNPVNLYTQQIVLQEYQTVSYGILGVNNSIFFTVYNLKSVPISGSGNVLPPALSFGNNNTQRGGDVTWTQTVSSATSLSASGGGGKTFSNVGLSLDTNYYYARLIATTRFGPKTTGFVGARYQSQSSDVPATNYNETAVFAGLTYTFQ